MSLSQGTTRAHSIHEAKTQFSKLVKLAEAGEEVIIRRGPTPVAKLVRYEPPRRITGGGFLKGKIWISPDFDEPLEDFAEYM